MGVDDLAPATRLPVGRKAREATAQESDDDEEDDDESDDEEDEEEAKEIPSPRPTGPGSKRSRQVGRTISAEVVSKRRMAQMDLPEEDAEITLPKRKGTIYFSLLPSSYFITLCMFLNF